MRLQTISEARWIIAILACTAIASWFVSAWLALLFVALIFGTILFFRDPDRDVPADPNAIVAAADGRVTEISEVEESPFHILHAAIAVHVLAVDVGDHGQDWGKL